MTATGSESHRHSYCRVHQSLVLPSPRRSQAGLPTAAFRRLTKVGAATSMLQQSCWLWLEVEFADFAHSRVERFHMLDSYAGNSRVQHSVNANT